MSCSLAGYTKLVSDNTKLALTAITMNMALIESMISLLGLKYIAYSVDLMYDFLVGFAGW